MLPHDPWREHAREEVQRYAAAAAARVGAVLDGGGVRDDADEVLQGLHPVRGHPLEEQAHDVQALAVSRYAHRRHERGVDLPRAQDIVQIVQQLEHDRAEAPRGDPPLARLARFRLGALLQHVRLRLGHLGREVDDLTSVRHEQRVVLGRRAGHHEPHQPRHRQELGHRVHVFRLARISRDTRGDAGLVALQEHRPARMRVRRRSRCGGSHRGPIPAIRPLFL